MKMKLPLLLLLAGLLSTAMQADERYLWQQFNSKKAFEELDAEFGEPAAPPPKQPAYQPPAAPPPQYRAPVAATAPAPAQALTQVVPPVPTPPAPAIASTQQQAIKTSIAGIDFELQGCTLSKRTVRCQLTLTSNEFDRGIELNTATKYGFPETTMTDDLGHQYSPSWVSVGNKQVNSGNRAIAYDLPADRIIQAELFFKNISSKASGVSFIEIGGNNRYANSKFKVELDLGL